jgi:hypothetical protein
VNVSSRVSFAGNVSFLKQLTVSLSASTTLVMASASMERVSKMIDASFIVSMKDEIMKYENQWKMTSALESKK